MRNNNFKYSLPEKFSNFNILKVGNYRKDIVKLFLSENVQIVF